LAENKSASESLIPKIPANDSTCGIQKPDSSANVDENERSRCKENFEEPKRRNQCNLLSLFSDFSPKSLKKI
jgi:hypothetical protein